VPNTTKIKKLTAEDAEDSVGEGSHAFPHMVIKNHEINSIFHLAKMSIKEIHC
jgi:hypothetical protein